MAIYVPNVEGYFPKIEPFTPDYKFLSDVLTTRTDKYEKNFSKLNDVYSQIVYADLGRDDTRQMREQFVNKLQPMLEKISGMDLSLARNVQSAQAVFQPFYDNNTIISDMVQTKNINAIQQTANNQRISSDEDTRLRFNPVGLEFAMYSYDNFLNSSAEEAPNMPLARYIENPQLFKRAFDYLTEKGWKLKTPSFSEDGAYKITTTNGEDVTSLFYSQIREIFSKDPLVQDAYFADAYVRARKYADAGMEGENPMFSNVTEGMAEYNRGIVESSQQTLALQYDALSNEIKTIEGIKSKYDEYLTNHSFVPGSEDEIIYNNLLLTLEGKQQEMEQIGSVINQATQMLERNDPQELNNRGFNILFQNNIKDDLMAAAQMYSALTKDVEIEVDELYKIKYQAQLARQLEGYKSRLRKEEKLYEARLEQEQNAALAQLNTYTGIDPFVGASAVAGFTREGKPTDDPELVDNLTTQEMQFDGLTNELKSTAAGTLYNILNTIDALDTLTNTFGIDVNKKPIDIVNALQKQDLDSLITALDKHMVEYEKLSASMPEDYLDIMSEYSATIQKLKNAYGIRNEYEEIKQDNMIAIEGTTEMQNMMASGTPSILLRDNQGNITGIAETYDEYEEYLLENTDYVPRYTDKKTSQALKSDIIEIFKRGDLSLLPDDFVITKKIKSDGKIIEVPVFNSDYFYDTEGIVSTSGFEGQVLLDRVQTNALADRAATTANLLKYARYIGMSEDQFDEAVVMNRNNKKEQKQFEVQRKLLSRSLSGSDDPQNSLYKKFDLRPALLARDDYGNLKTSVGVAFPLRTKSRAELADPKLYKQALELKNQEDIIRSLLTMPQAVITTEVQGEDGKDVINTLFNELTDKAVDLNSKSATKTHTVANVEYTPSIVPGGDATYKIKLSKLTDPTTTKGYSFASKEVVITIPDALDPNTLKSSAYETNLVGRNLKASEKGIFEYKLGKMGKVIVAEDQYGRVKFDVMAPYLDKNNNIKLRSLKFDNNILPKNSKRLDSRYFELQRKLNEVARDVISKKQLREEAEKQNQN